MYASAAYVIVRRGNSSVLQKRVIDSYSEHIFNNSNITFDLESLFVIQTFENLCTRFPESSKFDPG